MCICDPDFTGSQSCTQIDDCEGVNCNDGVCEDGINNFTCNCTFGYTGFFCESNINDCMDIVCQNEADCLDLVGNFTCECLDGYQGRFCEDEINFCDTEPCTSGMCMPLFNNFSCICYPGWTGRLCDEDIDYCVPISPCSNGGVCMEGNSTFNCDCSTVDFEGLTCDMRIDNCDPDPCENGTCTDLTRNYMCNCFDGFMGRNCSVDIDECDTLAPCQNGGTCNNFDGGYSCECPSGYTGQNCSEDVNECEVLQPCQNNATCINSEGDCICQCANYFEDKNCSTVIPDPCDDQPCDNGVCKRMTARSLSLIHI